MAKKYVTVHDQQMAYVDQGSGRPVLLLHGNPTSSYLWRDVIPELTAQCRCIAPDLIGMGDSAKLQDADAATYSFATHAQFLEGFVNEVLAGEEVLLVLHDWGSALGFDWANRHRQAVRGIAYMEAIVRPLAAWEEFSPAATPIFQALRSEAGESLILDKNIFIERILPGSVLRDLTDEEMAEYRRPFVDRLDRFPTLTWPRSIPIAGDPPEMVEIVQNYADWLAMSSVPKLFIDADPGAILIGAQREFCRSWPNQQEVQVKGSHFIQEDSGREIGQAIMRWMDEQKI